MNLLDACTHREGLALVWRFTANPRHARGHTQDYRQVTKSGTWALFPGISWGHVWHALCCESWILVPNHPSGFIQGLVIKLTFVSCAPWIMARNWVQQCLATSGLRQQASLPYATALASEWNHHSHSWGDIHPTARQCSLSRQVWGHISAECLAQ